MRLVHNFKQSPDVPLPKWALDTDVMRAIYNEIHRLTAAGKKTKKLRAEYLASVRSFDSFSTLEITPFAMVAGGHQGHWNLGQASAMYVALHCDRQPNCNYFGNWHCRLYADLSVYTSSIPSRLWPEGPIVNAARLKWQIIVRWMIRVRPYAWHWFERHQMRMCAPDGLGRKRDLAEFERDNSEM